MSSEHARFADWDAAYALGALSAADRKTYEEHLAECAACTRAVGELTSTVGLLSRVPAERVRAGVETGSPGQGGRERIVDLAERRSRLRSRRRRTWWVAGAAAAAIVVAAVAVPLTIGATDDRGTVHALAELADVPLEASIRLTDAAWGTRIDLVCRYSGEVLDAPDGGWPYALAVVDADGSSTTLSTWRAAPGSTTQLSAGTDLGVAEIGAIEIRSVDGDAVLMRYDATR